MERLPEMRFYEYGNTGRDLSKKGSMKWALIAKFGSTHVILKQQVAGSWIPSLFILWEADI
jgi:hypothetical protein